MYRRFRSHYQTKTTKGAILTFEGLGTVAGVFDLGEYRANVKRWTKADMRELEARLLESLRQRSSTYLMETFAAEEGAPVVCLIPREGQEATHPISNNGREYVLLGEGGYVWKRSERLSGIVEAALVP